LGIKKDARKRRLSLPIWTLHQSSDSDDIAAPPPNEEIVSRRFSQICNRARELQDVAIGSCRQIELAHAQHDFAARIKLSRFDTAGCTPPSSLDLAYIVPMRFWEGKPATTKLPILPDVHVRAWGKLNYAIDDNIGDKEDNSHY